MRAHKKRVGFPSVVLRATVLTHVPVALAWAELARMAGASHALAWGALLATAPILLLRGRLAAMLWDRPRTTAERWLEPPYFVHWGAAFSGFVPIVLVCLGAVVVDLARGLPPSLPTRPALITYLVFLGFTAWAVLVRRGWVVVRRLDVPVRDLPAGFDGYRIVHLSDLHVGGLLAPSLADRWVRLAAAEDADLAVVTGDVITAGTAFHEDAAALVARFAARDGVVFSFGNHDHFDGPDLARRLEARGVRVLVNDSWVIERGQDRLRIAGVDDTWTRRADLARALEGAGDGAPTVLLAHDPDLFDDAARKGADLVLSGHTHAGQIALPFFTRAVNLARLSHENTWGLYRRGDAVQYVHAGLGTTGPPIRFGAAPEVVVLTLRRAAA